MSNIILKTNVVISYLCCLGLTKCCLLSFCQIILSVSLAAAKKQKQRLQLSPESKEVQRKGRKIKRQAESAKEAAKQKRKNRDSMVRNHQAESAKEAAKQKRKNRDSMVRNCQAEIAKEAAKQKKEDRNSKRRKRFEVNAIH